MEKYLGIIRKQEPSVAEPQSFNKKCPGCVKVVSFVPDKSTTANNDSIPISHSVDCGNGHFFCWECLALQGHAPVACNLWEKWHEKCAKMDTLGNLLEKLRPIPYPHFSPFFTGNTYLSWLMSNNRPCPNCGQSINKVDGCNRVRCNKCAFECCWICLESWRKHPMCNRFLDNSSIELRFLHFYIRYKNHHNSYIMEKAIDFGSSLR